MILQEDGASEPVQGKWRVEKSSGTMMALTSKVSPLKGGRIARTIREGCNSAQAVCTLQYDGTSESVRVYGMA